MDTAIRDYPPGDLRVSDADRDRALSELSEALQAGRITAGEFGERSGQVLRARTGKELTAPLADLPLDRAPAARISATEPPETRAPETRAGVMDPAHAVLVARGVMGASAVAATALAATAVANGLSTGPSMAHRELVREILARQGLSIPLPPAPGFDWAGTITPAVIAVLLVTLIIVLRLTRADRP